MVILIRSQTTHKNGKPCMNNAYLFNYGYCHVHNKGILRKHPTHTQRSITGHLLDIEYIAGMDCGRPRGGRYPHRSYSIVVEYALCESERSAAIQLRYSCDSAAPRSIQIYSDSARLFVSAPFPCPFLRKVYKGSERVKG